jgi:hypothetical protein
MYKAKGMKLIEKIKLAKPGEDEIQKHFKVIDKKLERLKTAAIEFKGCAADLSMKLEYEKDDDTRSINKIVEESWLTCDRHIIKVIENIQWAYSFAKHYYEFPSLTRVTNMPRVRLRETKDQILEKINTYWKISTVREREQNEKMKNVEIDKIPVYLPILFLRYLRDFLRIVLQYVLKKIVLLTVLQAAWK